MSAPWLRPSALPKLALCGQYRPETDAGPAAARGTKLDELFRRVICGENVSLGDLVEDDKTALRWAVDTARALAGGSLLEAREEMLRVEACGLNGTADLLCGSSLWSADLKTGQVRNYREQQAAYALGFMDRYFVEEWTIYLLFCDQREVVTLHFNYNDASQLVRGAIAKTHDAGPPTPNDYCGWCANRMTCPARLESVALVVKDGAPLVASATSDQLREFALKAKVVEEFAEQAREELRNRIAKGEKVPGCSLVSKRGSRKVAWSWFEHNLKKLGTAVIGRLVGDISESKALPEIEAQMPGVKIPDEYITETPGSSFVRIGRPKA